MGRTKKETKSKKIARHLSDAVKAAKNEDDGRKWFEVTVTESYHATYKVRAMDQQEADDLANEAVNCGQIDPTNDGNESYERETSVSEGSGPEVGDLVIENGADE